MGPDRWVSEHLHEWVSDHPLVADVLRFVTAFGRPQALVVATALVAAVVWRRGRGRAAVFLIVATLGAWLVDNALKDVFDRARPVFDEPLARSAGASFPSGHAMTSAAAFGALALLVRRRWSTVGAAAVVAAIAFTRVSLGVHWLTDVIAGVALGVAWMLGCARVLLRGDEAEDLRPGDRALAEDLPRAPGGDREAQPR